MSLNGNIKKAAEKTCKHRWPITTLLTAAILVGGVYKVVKEIKIDTVAKAQETLGIPAIVEGVNQTADCVQELSSQVNNNAKLIGQHEHWIEAFESSQIQYQRDMTRLQEHQNITDERVERLTEVIIESMR